MGSLYRRERSPYWFAKFRDESGRIIGKSTKLTDKKAAMKVLNAWEEAAEKARHGELTQAASIKLLSELMERTIGERLNIQTTEKFFTSWLNDRSSVGETTVQRYKPIIEGFIGHLGPNRAGASLASLTPSEIERFRDKQTEEGKGATTANFAVKVIRAALNKARKKGLILSNPAESLDDLHAEAEEREPLTDDEIRALLVAAGETDWRGMILLGTHCGLRINDAASLTWQSIDLERRFIKLRPQKTRKTAKAKDIQISLHPDLVAHFQKVTRGIGQAPLFPTLHGKKSGSAGGLSDAFAAIMAKAGVIATLGEEKTGKGRRFRSKGFHSFRHTLVSKLANADIGQDVRKLMVGHNSDKVHERYTHLALETQARAVGKLPSVL